MATKPKGKISNYGARRTAKETGGEGRVEALPAAAKEIKAGLQVFGESGCG